jgi:hypothetical protein
MSDDKKDKENIDDGIAPFWKEDDDGPTMIELLPNQTALILQEDDNGMATFEAMHLVKQLDLDEEVKTVNMITIALAFKLTQPGANEWSGEMVTEFIDNSEAAMAAAKEETSE